MTSTVTTEKRTLLKGKANYDDWAFEVQLRLKELWEFGGEEEGGEEVGSGQNVPGGGRAVNSSTAMLVLYSALDGISERLQGC